MKAHSVQHPCLSSSPPNACVRHSLSLSLHVNACIGMCRKLQFQPCSSLADSLTHGLIFIAGARPAGTEAGTGTGRVLDFSCGLSMALAGKGVIVDHQAFHNLTSSQLQHKGATIPGWQYYHHYFLSFFLFNFLFPV